MTACGVRRCWRDPGGEAFSGQQRAYAGGQRRNDALYETCSSILPIPRELQRQRGQRIGHLLRRGDGRLAKQLLFAKIAPAPPPPACPPRRLCSRACLRLLRHPTQELRQGPSGGCCGQIPLARPPLAPTHTEPCTLLLILLPSLPRTTRGWCMPHAVTVWGRAGATLQGKTKRAAPPSAPPRPALHPAPNPAPPRPTHLRRCWPCAGRGSPP